MAGIDMESDLRARVVALEQWRVSRDIESARHDERWSSMEKRLGLIEKDIGGIKDTLTWGVRVLIGGIILAMVAFMVRGGFSP